MVAVDVGEDVRSGGGDGRDEDSEELTLLEGKVGDWRVGDWTGPRGKGEVSAMRKKETDQERMGIYRTKDEDETKTNLAIVLHW